MALVDNAWYINYGDGSAGAGKKSYFDVVVWSNHTAVAGEIIRQLTAPAVGSERVFVCTTAGATGAVEPTWTNTRGALNTSSSAVYQECTGIAALNGDATNTPSWTITATPPGGVKGTAVTLGQVIKRDSGASYQICTTAGTAGSGAEPAFSNTAGTTTADNTVTWTSLGVVGNFTGWQAPHARLQAACTSTWGQNGNSFYLASNHAETQTANMTVPSIGSAALPIFTYSVDRTVAMPPTTLLNGATLTTTTSGTLFLGTTYGTYYGMTFSCGSGANTPALTGPDRWGRFINCAFVLGGTSAQTIVTGGANPGINIWENTTVQVGNVGSGVRPNGSFIWKNTATAIVGATLPTNIFLMGSVVNGSVPKITGVDLSALGSNTLFQASGQGYQPIIMDCKLGASATIAGTPTNPFSWVDFIRCDSAATAYIHGRSGYMGTQSTETTIVRTGGATDGTTPLSWKFVTTANSRWTVPFDSLPISIWNDSTSAITTLTIYGTTTGGGVPNNDDIWVEVEYLGSGSTPQGSFITSTKADNLAAAATTNNSSDASTWGGGGAGNGFKIVVPSFTPGQKGPLNITIKAAKVSSTYYIDPKPSISGVTVSKSQILAPGVYANELSSGSGGISRARAASGF